MLWGEHWGSSADAIQDVAMAPDMADLTLTPTIPVKVVTHILGGETLVLSDAVGKAPTITIINAIDFTEDLSAVIKRLGDWEYIFTQPDKDGRFKLVDNWDPL
jgi:hypothetical protein